MNKGIKQERPSKFHFFMAAVLQEHQRSKVVGDKQQAETSASAISQKNNYLLEAFEKKGVELVE